MGGYGALRLGAKYADRFKAIPAHSPITDIAEMEGFVEEPLSSFATTAPREELSALHWLLAPGAALPLLRFDCGTADRLIEGNRALNSALVAARIPHVYQEFEGGHEWSYWTEHVTATLQHIASANAESKPLTYGG